MKSIRLSTIASLINKDSIVLDIGTDHAYLPIFLITNNITNNVIASDISDNVLMQTKDNIKKHNLEDKIRVIESDGFKNIDIPIDVAVISGMGTYTIINILKSANDLPNTLIIQSNNNLNILRKFMNDFGYKINQELVVFENNKYYVIIKYLKGKSNLSEDEIEFGLNNNIEYLNYCLDSLKRNYLKSNNVLLEKKIKRLEHFIEKIQD